MKDIDCRFHDDTILVVEHSLECCHEAKVTQVDVEVGSVLELEGERVGACFLKEVGELSISIFWYGIIF